MRLIICFLILLCPYFILAQSTTGQVIKVGDAVPEIEFKYVLNNSKVLKLSEQKGKLVILDFWATWCGSCIKKFNMLDSLQQKHADQLTVVLVNSIGSKDTKEKLDKFYSRHVGYREGQLGLPIAYNDSIAGTYFPHKFIPHFAWINEHGICIAITGADEVTALNIEALLQKKPVQFVGLGLLNEINFKKPLFVSGNGGNGEGILYRSTFSKSIPGLPSVSHRSLDSLNRITHYTITNTPLLNLIKMAFGVVKRDDRIIIPEEVRQEWFALHKIADTDHRYTYELITAPVAIEKALDFFRKDIERCFDLTGHFESKPIPCYKLTADTNKLKVYKTRGGKPRNRLHEKDERFMQNKTLATLATYLDAVLEKNVILSSKPAFNLDLIFPLIDMHEMESVKKALAVYGLRLEPTVALIEQFIIHKK